MKVTDIVSKMTLDEKASMVSGKDFWHLDEIDHLDIPSVMVCDGPHGLRKQDDSADHLGINDSIKAVCFPTAAGTACSFDRDMMYEMGQVLGEECQAENVSILLGPAVNIKRSPLCGRNFEYISEDPYLTGELAASYINGVQSKNVGTSIKHFAVNNQEKRRLTVSAVVDERTLREIYLPGFETAVKKAQPWTVMCAYNQLNGEYCSQHDYLLNQILRKDWDFKGYVVTDWGAAVDRVKGIPAGLELEMPSSGMLNTNKIIEAVQNGFLDEKALDTACERILEKTMFYTEHHDTTAELDLMVDHKKALNFAKQSMVLLKNDNNLLPLSEDAKIAFIGEFAKKPRFQGGGSSHINTDNVVSAYDVVRNQPYFAGYAKGFPVNADKVVPKDFANALELARDSDIAVVFAGLPEYMESEGFDRDSLDMPRCQNLLIEEIVKVQQNTVVVLHNGSAVTMPWVNKVPAILESYLAGETVGQAQMDILFGETNPSGKLAESFPWALSDTSCYNYFPGHRLTVEHREGIYVGYRYYDTVQKDVMFPFGHGLSYTTFEYTGLKLSKKSITEKDTIEVSLKVKNTGKCDGAEIVQVYVEALDSKVFRSKQELKGFTKVFLKAGEEKAVSVELNARAFAYYNIDIADWYCESGKYNIHVAASSRDIRLTDTITLKNSKNVDSPYKAGLLPEYYAGRVNVVTNESFTQLLGFSIPEPKFPSTHRFTLEDTLEDVQYTFWGGMIVKALNAVTTRVKLLGDNPMLEKAAMEMPFRSLVGMSGGIFTEDMANALLDLFNSDNKSAAGAVLVKGFVNAVKTIVAGDSILG